MNYNIVVIISLVICAIISWLLSYYLSFFIFGENSSFFKISQLVIAILSMTTFYAPIKHMLLKHMKIDDITRENEND